MSMSVTVTLSNTTGRIERGVLDPATSDAISEACTYETPQAANLQKASKFAKRGRAAHWDGKVRLYHRGHRKFPAGLANRVVAILEERGYDPHIEFDIEEVGSGHIFCQPGDEWAPRDYQEGAIQTAIDEMRCMIRVATGGGKTPIAGHLIHRLRRHAVFLVHTKDLLYQAKDTFIAMFGEAMVGQIGDGEVDPRPITVATIQTIARAVGLEDKKITSLDDDHTWKDNETDASDTRIKVCLARAGVVIMDECHRVASETAVTVIEAIPNAVYRYGLSASPWRDDNADLVLEGVFGHVAVEINATTLIEQGHLVAPVIRFVQVPGMAFDKDDKYPTIYKEYIEENHARNSLGASHALRMVNRGRPTLVLIRNIKHGNTIKAMLEELIGRSVPFISGKDDSDLRRSVVRGMRDGTERIVIASTIADEGLDVKPLSGLVLLGSGKSSTRALQRVGRVLRPHPDKVNAEVVDFEDNCRILINHSQKRREIYETEPAFNILDV